MPISWIPSKSILESKIKAEQSALDWLQNPEKYDWLNNQPSPETPPPETPPKKFQPPTWATQPQQQPDLGKTLSSWIAGSMREAAQRGAAPQDVITAPIKPLITGQLPPSYQRPPTTEERSQGQYAYQPTWAGQQAYEQWQPPGVKLPGTENPVLGALSGMVGAQPFQGGGTELNVKSALEMAPWLAIPGGFRGSAGVAEKVAGKAKPAIQEMLASERGSIGKIPKEIPKIEQPPIGVEIAGKQFMPRNEADGSIGGRVHGVAVCPQQSRQQPGIPFDIAPAKSRCKGDFLDQLREDLAALRIDGALLPLDGAPL